MGRYGIGAGVYAVLKGEVVAGTLWFALTTAIVGFRLRAKSMPHGRTDQCPV